MNILALPDIGKVLLHTRADIYFTKVATGFRRKLHRIIVSLIRCSEARHRDRMYALPIVTQTVKCRHSDEQCKRGVKSTGETNESIMATYVLKSFRQSRHLYQGCFLHGFQTLLGICRDKRHARNLAR